VTTISVTRPRGVDDTVLLGAVYVDGEAEPHRVILAPAQRKCLRPLLWGKQQVVQRWDRSVVQVGRRGPDPLHSPRPRRHRRAAEYRAGCRAKCASAPVEILHRPLLCRIDSGRRVGLLLDAVHRRLNGPANKLPTKAAPALTPAQSLRSCESSAV
jgi:hypothetical protein